MSRDEILKRFSSINVWKKGDERAPHKPLLILFALGKCSRGEDRLIPFSQVDSALQNLLLNFGPQRKSIHPEYPFWRMRSDGIWVLSDERIQTKGTSGDVARRELLQNDIKAGFTKEIYAELRTDNLLIAEITEMMLARNFPESLHEEILDAVGLDILSSYQHSSRRKRDPIFRDRILQAYGYRCAICGSELRLGEVNIGLEAAHIKWHQAGGPDIEENGLSLCIFHHKLFDRGAFTISEDRIIQVSQLVNGNGPMVELLLRYHNQHLSNPIKITYYPKDEFISWHIREVFKAPWR